MMKFHEISWFSWFFANFMILWKMWNSWNFTFSSKSGSQNTWFPIGNQSYSACWAMQMSILWHFMKVREIPWFQRKWKIMFLHNFHEIHQNAPGPQKHCLVPCLFRCFATKKCTTPGSSSKCYIYVILLLFHKMGPFYIKWAEMS